MDRFPKEKRSEIMSKIRGKWTKPERRLHNILKGLKVRHKMHPKMFGNPDAVLKDARVVIFVDGCFWHGCPRHFRLPETNRDFWKRKIERNRKRDREVTRKLINMGYRVIRLWECQLSSASLRAAVARLSDTDGPDTGNC